MNFFQHIVTYSWACCYSECYSLFSTQFPMLPFKPIGKDKLLPMHTVNMYGEWHSYLTLAQVGVECSVSHSTGFNPGESVCVAYQRIASWPPNIG